MRWILILAILVVSGCAHTTKTSVSVYLEKDLWIDSEFHGKPDAKTRLEYRVEQTEPWPFQPRHYHE